MTATSRADVEHTELQQVPDGRPPAVGVGVAMLLVAVAIAVPPLFGWDVHAREDGRGLPPLHGYFAAKVGLGTIPAIVLAVLAWRHAARLARVLSWRRVLLVSYAAALAWLVSLAFVDGADGISRALGNGYEYLPTARDVGDVPAMISGFVDKIPYSAAPDNWVTHVAGHPVGALLFFVGLVRLGLGGDFTAGLVVTVLVASTAPAVLVAVRALGAEHAARRVAPFLVFTPAAVFMAVSADALFAVVTAWGLAALALGATARSRGRSLAVAMGWSAVAGLLLGCCVELSYGLPLLGLLAVAVLLAGRSWSPLPIAAGFALVPVLVLAGLGFAWWDAYPVLLDRYHAGIAMDRPEAYWWWGNLAALLICAGPLLAAGLARAASFLGRARTGALRVAAPGDRVLLLLVMAAVASISIADASGMSKAEVERIWLPFVPWLTLSVGLLSERWRRGGLAAQLMTALLVQHLLYTSW